MPDKQYNQIIQSDIKDLKDVIREVVREELNASHYCRFDISDTDAKQLGHYFGMMSDLGDGKIGSGIETIRDNHKWLKKQRDVSNKISFAVVSIFVAVLVGGAIKAFWIGLKTFLVIKP